MHGTPIEINAKKANTTPLKYVDTYFKEHQKDIKTFLVEYDNFHKTHSEENKELATLFFTTLKKKKFIYTKTIEQMYDEQEERFLPDRFIKGTCPKCQAEDQYGDICEKCSSSYTPTDLINPYSTITNTKPILKESTHYFFKLSAFEAKLKKWLSSTDIQPEIQSSLKQWLKDGLKDWCISRDAPYFGFEIPDSKKETGETKFFYVWLDAPIGYMSSTKHYTDKNKLDFNKTYKDVIHFIGKDIVYFHYLFWPALLMGMGYDLPRLNTHGFITVNGKKMSKSRGTYITANEFAKNYEPESLRFFFAGHLDRKLVDIDLDLKGFQSYTNSVLLGNLGNFCFRTLSFAHKNYGSISKIKKEPKLEKNFNQLVKKINESYDTLDYKNAVKYILQISDIGNQYFQENEPWKNKEQSEEVVGFCINLARNLAILSSPILPLFSEKIMKSLNIKKFTWDDMSFTWKGNIKPPHKLVEKIDEIKQKKQFPIQMRVGKIQNVRNHPDADSLYLFDVDFGNEKRQVVAGLKKYFTVDQLDNKVAVFVVNLKPAKIRGELSKAMSLIAEDTKNLAFLDPGKAKLGSYVEFEGTPSINEQITFDDFMKIKMKVKLGHIFYEEKPLMVGNIKVQVTGVKDGAKIS